MPQFSVVIPTYNRAQVISRALDSVLLQSIHDWECLVIDDFSTDSTKEIISDYCNEDSRFKYLINENEKGANGARNTGILHAQGEYVFFLDSDDRWHPEMIESQLNKYLSDGNISVVYTKIQSVLPDGTPEPWDIFTGLEGYIYDKVLEQGYMSPTISLSAKRECFENVGFFDSKFPASQDDDMCFRLAKKYKVGFIPKILADVTVSDCIRISDNRLKVSMGWWMLWNKYENDVIEYCGERVMAKHYKECLHHFVHANNAKMSWKAYRKFTRFGGAISKKEVVFLFIYILSLGKIIRITHKIQKMI